jgi:hypothetical protein
MQVCELQLTRAQAIISRRVENGSGAAAGLRSLIREHLCAFDEKWRDPSRLVG